MAAAITDLEHDLVFVMARNPGATWREIAIVLGMSTRVAQRHWQAITARRPDILPSTLLALHRTSRRRVRAA